MSEYTEQVALFEWAKWMAPKAPELDLLFAIPNGELRHKAVAAKLKAAGVKAGVPDMMLCVPRNGKHGLFIELKIGNNRCSAFQNRWLADLRAQGYACHVCYGWVEAACVLVRYLGYAPTAFGLESAIERVV